MNVRNGTTTVGLLGPSLLNPAVAAAVGIGLIGICLINLLGGDDDELAEIVDDRSVPPKKRFVGPIPADQKTLAVVEEIPSNEEETVAKTVEQPLAKSKDSSRALEEEGRERLRQVMSYLGKRSAAARARKRLAAQT